MRLIESECSSVSRSVSMLMTILSCTNLAFASLGFFWAIRTIFLVSRNPGPNPLWPFFTMSAINLVLLGVLTYASVLLWKRKRLGLKLSLGVYIAETSYFMLIGFIWATSGPSADAVAAWTGVGN